MSAADFLEVSTMTDIPSLPNLEHCLPKEDHFSPDFLHNKILYLVPSLVVLPSLSRK
jgi:hypothetical protein